jgi:hypothetical protein
MEMSDQVAAVAIAVAFAPRGARESLKTTPQLTEAEEAVRKRSRSGYRSATPEPRFEQGE